MKFSYLIWLIGIIIAVVIGVHIFYSAIPGLDGILAKLDPQGAAKALFVALGLVAISKLF